MPTEKPLFSDINFRVNSTPEELVVDAESINQNILSIFETPVGSKWFRPTIGSLVAKYLFEPIDGITAERLRSEMLHTLETNGEFRVKFDDIEVVPDPAHEQYYVRISYSSPALNNKYSFDFNLFR